MLSHELLDLLRCPACRSEAPLEESGSFLICHNCGRAYPVVDDIPHMLIEESRPVSEIGTATDAQEASE